MCDRTSRRLARAGAFAKGFGQGLLAFFQGLFGIPPEEPPEEPLARIRRSTKERRGTKKSKR